MLPSPSETPLANSIILLERDPQLRTQYTALLRSRGYTVKATGNEAEAHMMCRAAEPALVLVGASEPLRDMWETCEKLQRGHAHRKIALAYSESLRLCAISFEGQLPRRSEGPGDLLSRVAALLDPDPEPVAADCR